MKTSNHLWKIALFPLTLLTPLYGVVEESVDEKRPISISFSNTSHNRIGVEQGSVKKIFADETHFNISLDKATGQAFVSITRPFSDPLTLTVVTDTGKTQDLFITSMSKESEYLLLKEPQEIDPILPLETLRLHLPTIEFLNDILSGKDAIHYVIRAPRPEEELPSYHPLQVRLTKALENPFEEIAVYTITNKSRKKLELNPDYFKQGPVSQGQVSQGRVSWVFLNTYEIAPQSDALCIVSKPKRGE